LHNEGLRNFHSPPNKVKMIKARRIRWAGHIARMGETRNAYRILVGKPEGKRPVGRRGHRWECNTNGGLASLWIYKENNKLCD
jgi:hypothetical protein